MKTIVVNQKGARRIQGGHPWVFRSDVQTEDKVGDIVRVVAPNKQFLGMAFFNPRSQITLRILTRQEVEINRGFWRQRLQQAIQCRQPWGRDRAGLRLVFGEADFLPGLIIDRYRNVLVFQTLTLGMEQQKPILLDLMKELLAPETIVERNDVSVRELEGLTKQRGIIMGGLPDRFTIQEKKLSILVDPLEGHKTGLYLDQADNRRTVARYAHGRVLDAFCYQGEFGLHLAAVADEVVSVDSSGPALEKAKQNYEQNNITNAHLVEANVFDYLRDCQGRREYFDTIVLDPPPFVRGKKDAAGGLRGYKEINLRAMKILRPGGILATCSCSQNFTESMFLEMLQEAAHDAKRELQILEKRGAAPDHPVLLNFPESNYLQCWILRVL